MSEYCTTSRVCLESLAFVAPARRAKDHIHTDRGHGVASRSTIHQERSEFRDDRSKIIAHHKGVITIMQCAIYILYFLLLFIRTRNRLAIFMPLVI